MFRFPRRAETAALLVRECTWLPRLAGTLPVAIPVPEFTGHPTAAHPWPFAGYRRLAGQTACAVPLTASQRSALAASTGGFLAALHARPVPGALPGDAHGRTDPARLIAALHQRSAYPNVLALADALRHTPRWSGPPVWCHGDLYARHLLLDDHQATANLS